MKMERKEYQSMPPVMKGTCMCMCPESERRMREHEGLLNMFEVAPGTEQLWRPQADPARTVKSFSRSAAGQRMPDASELRPQQVLKRTVFYLLRSVVPVTEVHWAVVYDFVFDRLRAIRQDMVIQNLDTRHCIEILERIVRFHAYAGYRLCGESIEKFDAKINQTHLSECLKRLLVMYDECDATDSGTNLQHRPEMEALYLVDNLGSPEAMARASLLEAKWRTAVVRCAWEASLACWLGNYARVCRLLPKLPVLSACIASRYLPALRRHALLVMNTAFSSRDARYPASQLQTLLLYNTREDLLRECQHYNISVKDESILFMKGTFNLSSNVCSAQHVKYVDNKLSSLHVSDLLLGESQLGDSSVRSIEHLNQQLMNCSINS